MSVTAADVRTPGFVLSPGLRLVVLAIVVTIASVAVAQLFQWTVRWPGEWVIPLKAWITSFFTWLGNEAHFGLFSFKDVTRSISWLLSWPLHWTEVVLYRGVSDLSIPPMPWIAIVAGVAIFVISLVISRVVKTRHNEQPEPT